MFKVQGFLLVFEAKIFTILLFATSEYLRIDFVTDRLKV